MPRRLGATATGAIAGIVREDRVLEPPQLGAGLERQLLREHPPRLVEGLEGVGLAAAAVQREHQLPPQPLPERVLLERRTKGGDDLAMLSQRERRLELLFERIDAKGLEPPRLRPEPRSVREPVQRRAAPELQRERDRLGRGTASPARSALARLAEQLLEPQPVDARVRQRVSVGRRDDRLRAERSPKTSDVVLDSVARCGRQVVSPQRVDQRVDGDDATAAKREQGKEARRLPPLTFAGRPPTRTSNGPRSRTSSGWPMCAAKQPARTSLARSCVRG